MTRSFRFAVSALLTYSLAGCSRNPNVEIVGSYFPGWMISLAAAVALTGVAHVLLRRKGLLHAVGHPALIYPSMVLLFTCLLWLCFFA
ncbi:MAG: YtcA family lipoprotein [Edaphobacter sp.]|uniref:YtcA family lipoprotein n=1 Tax=Edaphobacter sp. TaxID=1934404 RepID=UPI0023A5F8D4|nr:YtcA family lipoprotein [Edaphobacter sp.]MDE1174984.1 YtcA family lipoprotein [Edaphobacter sp.]